VKPEEYILAVNPIDITEGRTRENIDLLKEYFEDCGGQDLLAIYASGKEDGRHRACAAKELGIEYVPGLAFGKHFLEA
jgi:hypothetical protein